MPQYVKLAHVPSTNTYLKQHAGQLTDGTVIHTPHQTAGRGQQGNRWISQPGMNATFSYLFKDTAIEARKQFVISQATALAVAQTLSRITGQRITVKWPNDIYHADNKLCGVLIENSLSGQMVDYSVIGIGINVNQREFDPYAPNPTSLALITGQAHDVQQVMRQVCQRLELLLHDQARHRPEALHEQYLQALYRHDGLAHRFVLADGTVFAAVIAGVDRDGMLTLRHVGTGSVCRYAFKQVAYIIEGDRDRMTNVT